MARLWFHALTRPLAKLALPPSHPASTRPTTTTLSSHPTSTHLSPLPSTPIKSWGAHFARRHDNFVGGCAGYRHHHHHPVCAHLLITAAEKLSSYDHTAEVKEETLGAQDALTLGSCGLFCCINMFKSLCVFVSIKSWYLKKHLRRPNVSFIVTSFVIYQLSFISPPWP